MFRILLTFAIFISSEQLFSQDPANSGDKVLATVNGINILHSEFEEKFRQRMLFVSKEAVSKEEVLNSMINRELGILKAKKEGTDKNPIVLEKMEDVLYHAQISKDLEDKFKSIKEVEDPELKKYYDKHKEIRTRHILFRVRAEPSEEETSAALEQAMKIYSSLKKQPEKFAELANKYSQSSSAGAGGDLGFQPAVRYAPEYYNAIKDQTVGYISPPVRTQYGYHLIQVLEIKDFKNINKTLYKKLVYDEKRDKLIADYFASLRGNAKIKINKELL